VGCVRFWVLTAFEQVEEREREAGRNKRKKQKASLPQLHFQGKKKKNNAA